MEFAISFILTELKICGLIIVRFTEGIIDMFNDEMQSKDYLIYYLMRKLSIKIEEDSKTICFKRDFFSNDEYKFIIEFFLNNDFIDGIMEKTDNIIKLFMNNNGFRYLNNYSK